MWEIDLGNQIATLMLSLPLGGFFALVFFGMEAFRIADDIRGFRLWVNDIAFFAFAGFVSFCFLLVRSNGEVRGFVLIGELLGFWTFKLIFSKIYIKAAVWLIRFVKGVVQRILAFCRDKLRKIYSFSKKILKNIKNIRKKG